MTWNVYSHNINDREIKIYNVFQHYSFNKDVVELLKENLIYNEFSKKLKRIAQYYFWSKAEYEIVITSWLPYIDNKELDRLNSERENRQSRLYYVNLDIGDKIDVYAQLMLNWEQFAKYVYNSKEM